MSKLFGLTGRTADALTRKLGEAIHVGGKARSLPAARGVTWVKVTGAIVAGWYPGVVSLDTDGTFSDLSAAVQVQAITGATLVSGQRYLCIRTKNASDGKARFRTDERDVTFSTGNQPATYNIAADATWEDTGHQLTVPSTGRSIVGAIVTLYGKVSAFGVGNPPNVLARMWDSTASSQIAGALCINVPVLNVTVYGSFTLPGYDRFITAGHVVKLQVRRAAGPTWTTSGLPMGLAEVGNSILYCQTSN